MKIYVDKALEKQWEEASLSNNFIFCKVMSENLDLCKEFLEMLLNIKIESISLAQPETTLNVDFLIVSNLVRNFIPEKSLKSIMQR